MLNKISSIQKGVLAIGNPNSIEMGCGASLVRLSSDGHHVVAVVISKHFTDRDDNSVIPGKSKIALHVLGCNQVFHICFDETKNNSIEEIVEKIESIIINDIPVQIDIFRAYMINDSDRRGNYHKIYKASRLVCRNIPQLFGYETDNSEDGFSPQVDERASEKIFNQKIHAMSLQKDKQCHNSRKNKYIQEIAKKIGLQAGCKLSERVVVYKMIL